MTVRQLFIATLVLLTTLSFFVPAYAVLDATSVTIGGLAPQNNTVNTTAVPGVGNIEWIDLAGTYGLITIVPAAGGPCQIASRTTCARVEADDNGRDHLSLKNVRITFTQPVTNYTISFTGSFTPPPQTSTSPVTDVAYKLWMNQPSSASLTRSGPGASLDKVWARGEVEWPTNTWTILGGSDLYKIITATNFNFYSTVQQFTFLSTSGFTGNRKLRGKLWFTRTTAGGPTDTLTIPGNTDSEGLIVENTTSGGGATTVCPAGVPCLESVVSGPCPADVNWFCKIFRIFGCPDCVREDCPGN